MLIIGIISWHPKVGCIVSLKLFQIFRRKNEKPKPCNVFFSCNGFCMRDSSFLSGTETDILSC